MADNVNETQIKELETAIKALESEITDLGKAFAQVNTVLAKAMASTTKSVEKTVSRNTNLDKLNPLQFLDKLLKDLRDKMKEDTDQNYKDSQQNLVDSYAKFFPELGDVLTNTLMTGASFEDSLRTPLKDVGSKTLQALILSIMQPLFKNRTEPAQGELTTQEKLAVGLRETMMNVINSADTELNTELLKLPTAISEAFSAAIMEGDNLGRTLEELGKSIAALIVKAIAMRAVMGLVKILFPKTPNWGDERAAGHGGYTFARGGVFQNGRLLKLARGGVISGPTVFPMANGIGLMGEAGPEAVMPLARDASGRLGVRAAGGGAPGVVINVENRTGTPVGSRQTNAYWDEQMKSFVVGVILEDQATLGPITRNYRGGR